MVSRSIPDPTLPYARPLRGPRPPVVMLHGMRGCSELWEPVALRLEQRHEVLLVDLPGHGCAHREALDGLTFDGIVEGLAKKLGELFGCRPVHLVGHSLGGAVALTFAARHRVVTCTSIDEPLAVEAQTPAEVVAGLRSDAHERVVDELMAAVADSALGEEGVAAMSAAQALPRPARAGTLGLLSAVLDNSVPELVKMAQTTLGALSSPTLILLGRPCPSQALARLEAQAQVEIDHWSGSGHWLHLAEPERFVRRLEAFWASRCSP